MNQEKLVVVFIDGVRMVSMDGLTGREDYALLQHFGMGKILF